MLSALANSDGSRRGFRIVHLLRDAFPCPCCFYMVIKIHNIFCSFPNLICIEDDIVVVIVKHEGDIKLVAEGPEVMYRVADIVVLQHEAVFDVLW